MPSSKQPSSNNARVIAETEELQQSTREALERIQQQTALTEELGEFTLQGMHEQGTQLEEIESEGDRMRENLAETKRLQNRFDRWAMNWGGRKKREAKQQGRAIFQSSKKRDQQKERERERTEKQKIKEKEPSSMEYRKVPLPEDHLFSAGPVPSQEETVGLSQEDEAGLGRLNSADEEIDQMLDETAASLDRLASLSTLMQEESQLQSKKLQGIQKRVEGSQEKTAAVTARVKLNLVGKWRKRAEQE